MIERAGASVTQVPPDERDVSALTVCIREETLADVKSRVRRFREELLERCDSETEPERVYQLCIQFFPLSVKKRAPVEPPKPTPKTPAKQRG
jgi:uncharacterized protein (TIGR02147 family)